MRNLSKKIFITGATHGIGKATAELFSSNGWQVFGISSNHNDNRGKEMQMQLQNFYHKVIDVTNENKIAEFLAEIGPIDVAFNNAGIGIAPVDIENSNIDDVRRVIDVNLTGTLICLKHELRNMESGIIINNSSISALKTKTGADMCYSASKAGILRLTAELACDDKYKNRISFYSIIPGFIKTRMTAADNLPIEKTREPLDVAKLVYNIVSNNDVYCSGQCFNLYNGKFLL